MKNTENGTEVERKPMTFVEEQEIIQDVRTRYPEVGFPNVRLTNVYYKDMELGEDHPVIVENVLENQKLILSSDTQGKRETIPVATCSDEYLLVPHELAVWEFERMMGNHPEFPITDGLDIRFRGSAAQRMYASLTAPLAQKEVKVGDTVSVRAGFVNSIDKSKELTGYFDAIRLICKNGMTSSFMNKAISAKHRKCLCVEDHMKVIGENLHLFSDQFGVWQQWAEIEMSKSEAEGILELLPFGARYQEQILALPEAGTGETLSTWMDKDQVNAWDLNNAVVQFITHEVEAEAASQTYQDEVSRIFHTAFAGMRN